MIKFFHGKNKYLSLQAAQSHLATLQQELDTKKIPSDLITVDASETSAEKIIAELETPSLFSSHKLILLKRPSKNPDKESLSRLIIALVEKIPEKDDFDLIIWEDQKIPATSKLIKLLKSKKLIEESPELNKRTFMTWAKDINEVRETDIPYGALHLLASRSNYDPERFVSELGKLKLLGKESISEQDIEKVCPDTMEHTIWELIDSMNNGETSEAQSKLETLIRQGNDPLYILLMIARNLRILLLTKLLQNKGSSPIDIARKIHVPPFTINIIKRSAENTGMVKIKTLYDKISSIDYSTKTGQLDTELALHILLSVI